MAMREEMRHRVDRFRGEGHWFHDSGMPGWSRPRHGYPCLHMYEMGFLPPYDVRQELDLLRTEARELESYLTDVRLRIRELEDAKKLK